LAAGTADGQSECGQQQMVGGGAVAHGKCRHLHPIKQKSSTKGSSAAKANCNFIRTPAEVKAHH
jgi:hypothetical protein